jgi:hypothetical protein
MAAAFLSREEEGGLAKEHFRMPQPIPSYLVAFAVGQLSSKELGPRSRIWAEPALLDAAANEFSDVEKMIESAERLFGPYGWDRFDILTLPRSFPYGGMENPRLTFLTPTLLAGDKSLVNVLAHELAHSWTGNLVTNCSAEHFWLNEGFTVYAERRILEALEGRDTSALHAALGRRSLDSAIGHFKERPELTRLVPNLTSVDPDEAFSQIPYEKGYLFLKLIEETVGKERFDAFLQSYVHTFRFRSISTDDFKRFTESLLPGALEAVRADEWLYGPGVPSNAPASQSEKLQALQKLAGHLPRPSVAEGWSSVEWQLFLESLPHPSPETLLAELDSQFHLTENKNYEVLVSWLVLAAQSGYEKALGRIEEVLSEVGRLKYLKPLYMALAQRSSSKGFAQRCYSQYSSRYHPIARQVLEPLL